MHHQRVASTCYSQLQQLKDCTIFPKINYFLVKYPIFTFFSIHVHITTHNMSLYSVGWFCKNEGSKRSKNCKKGGQQDRKSRENWYKMLQNGQMTDFFEKLDQL